MRLDESTSTVEDILVSTFTDAVMVLHDGGVVDERYFDGMTETPRHLVMSVSKSIIGCVAGVLVGQGRLDPQAAVIDYVPQVAHS